MKLQNASLGRTHEPKLFLMAGSCCDSDTVVLYFSGGPPGDGETLEV